MHSTTIEIRSVYPAHSRVVSLLRLIPVLLVLAGVPSRLAVGQLPVSLQPKVESPSATTQGPEAATEPPASIDEVTALLEEKLDQARKQYENARQLGASNVAAQINVSEGKAAEKETLLRRQIRAYEKHLTALRKLADTQQAAEEVEAEILAWQGFPASTVFTVDLVDDLRDQVHAKKLEINALQVEQSLATDDLDTAQDALVEARAASVKLPVDSERDETAMVDGSQRWLQDLADLRERIAEAEAAQCQARLQMLEETIQRQERSLGFLEQKLAVAASNAGFPKAFLEERLDSIAATRAQWKDEKSAAERHALAAREKLDQALDALRTFRETEPAQGEPAVEHAQETNRREAIADMCRGQRDTADVAVDVLAILIESLDEEESVWQERFALSRVSDDVRALDVMERKAALHLNRVTRWQTYFDSNLRLTQEQLGVCQEKLSAWRPEDGDRNTQEEFCKAYTQREASYRRGLARTHELERLHRRWEEEISEHRRRPRVGERITGIFATALSVARKVWDYNIYQVSEDLITVDGQQVTRTKGITVGKVVLACLILCIGFMVARRLAARMRVVILERFKVEESVAAPVEKAFYYLLLVCVLLFALNTVKIPLTIFALFGGAIAIGVGFGAQNLINNFISGIILLLERPIKVGDIVDIGGIRGRVTNIGARCSQVRRFDGIDMLVPNSAFLEKDVTNWTLSDRLLRFDVSVGVAYGSPTREVSHLIAKAVEEHGKVLKHPEPIVIFEDFGDNSLVFTVYFWLEVNTFMDFRITASDIRFRIDKLFREAGITIAFPQRDVHLDTAAPVRVELVDQAGKESERDESDTSEGARPRRQG